MPIEEVNEKVEELVKGYSNINKLMNNEKQQNPEQDNPNKLEYLNPKDSEQIQRLT